MLADASGDVTSELPTCAAFIFEEQAQIGARCQAVHDGAELVEREQEEAIPAPFGGLTQYLRKVVHGAQSDARLLQERPHPPEGSRSGLAEESKVEKAVFNLGPDPRLVWWRAFVVDVRAKILPKSPVVGVVGAINGEDYADGVPFGCYHRTIEPVADWPGEAPEVLLCQVDLASKVACLKGFYPRGRLVV